MAGHNKWSKIRHRKAVVDKRRSKAWTMCSRAIISAARQHGPDPNFNFALRAALEEARYHNVPNENVERAIKKGAGGGEQDNYEFVRYEGYGPGGAAVIIDALTNNRARTAGDVRLIFANHEAKFGMAGSVSHMFEHKGRIEVLAPESDEDKIMEAALNAGAEDVVRLEGTEEDEDGNELATFIVVTTPQTFLTVRDGLKKANLKLGEAALEMVPLNTIEVNGDPAKALLAFIEDMEDNEDVKKVYTNAALPDE